jgi:multidrug resistance efflux pump
MTVAHLPSVQRWLQDHCESSVQVQGGLVIAASAGQAQAQPIAEWPAAGGMTPPLAAVAQAALQRSRAVVLAPTVATGLVPHNRVISVPLQQGDRTVGAVALALQADNAQDVDQLFKALQTASQGFGESLFWAALATPAKRLADGNQGIPHSSEKHNASDAAASDPAMAGATSPTHGPSDNLHNEAASVLQLQDLFLRHATLADGAMALCSHLAAILGCDSVALAAQRADAQQSLQLLALSNSAEVQAQQDTQRLMTAAMQEALDQGARVVYPAATVGPARIVLAHAEMFERSGQALATVALVHAQEGVGALLAQWRGQTKPTPAQLDFLDSVACVLAPLVALRQRAEQSLLQRGRALLRGAGEQATRRHDPLPKILAVASLTALAAASFVYVDFRVGATARIEGAVQRVVAAPMDGFLNKSHVRPGDSVKAGDVLVEMASQDLVLEQRKWEAALTQHENGFAAALARADRAQFVVAQGKASEASAQLELVRQQLARTKLVAPIDGVVIRGDISQNLGAPVQRGDALMTLAPAQQYRLIVEVDERDVAHIQPGQKGQLALASLPADTLAFVVERVTPVAVVRDGRNVFEVEAKLNAATVTLRPGLQGIAKIEAGQASTVWIWGHRAWHWLRLSLWSWAP